MKNITTLRLLLVVALFTSLTGCKKSSRSGNSSRGTGWQINAKQGGFQYNTNFKDQETAPGLVFVEGGTYTMGKVQDDVMHDWNNSPNQQHVQSFYMDETEVTNLMYLEYLDWIKRVYPPTEDNFKKIYEGAVPDTLVWRNRLGYSEMMVENYLRHPAFRNYPVVGVSWIQAVEYANWRSDRVAEKGLQEKGYLKRDSNLTDTSAESNFNIDTYINAPTSTFGGNEDVLKGGKRKIKMDSEGNEINVYANRETGAIQLNDKVNINGKLGVGVKNFETDADITTAGPVRFQGKKQEVADNIPTSGTYKLGDIVWNSNPVPTGYIGWVCIRDGSPGEWKSFAQISA